MSEEKRRILDMVEQGTITQEDAARLLEALGENEPAPAQPQESQPPQDGTWEAEHQGDEDCQGPNQRVEIHLEGEPWTMPRRCLRIWGKSWRTPSPPPPRPWTPPGPR